jgi:hypothetical protein
MDEFKIKFEIINIKLQTSTERRLDAYIKLFKDLVEKRIHIPVAENKHLILYGCYQHKTESGIDYLYGKIGKGVFFDNREGLAIDLTNGTSEKRENDQDTIINAITCEYIFIPTAHRFCFQIGKKIYSSDVIKFMKEAIKKIQNPNDIVRIEIENEPDAINEIMNATKIHKLNYVISYTNDDALGATANLFDQRLKRSGIGKIEVKAEADHNSILNFKGEELLEGGIELSRSNGIIKSASITNVNGVKKTVSSNKRPFQLELSSTYDKFRSYLTNKIMREFRSDETEAKPS